MIRHGLSFSLILVSQPIICGRLQLVNSLFRQSTEERVVITVSGVPSGGIALIDSIVVFIVSLLIGALSIYTGARVVVGYDGYTYATVTALIGAITRAVVSFFLGWIPFVGPLLALIAYIAVIKARYPGGWVKAILIALVAWIASIIVLYVLAAIGFASFEVVGVPGV